MSRTKLAPEGRIDSRHGIPTVVAPLIVVQLSQLGYGFLAERVANNFLKRNVATPAEILACLDDAGPGRRGSAALRTYCLRALEGRGHDDSPPARDLVSALKRAGLEPLVTQHYVNVDGHDHFLDVAWPDYLVGIEYNGWEDHGLLRDSFDRDAFRRSRLTAAGWRILDVTSAMTDGFVIDWATRMLRASGFWLPRRS